jgi:hypothetical protein
VNAVAEKELISKTPEELSEAFIGIGIGNTEEGRKPSTAQV